MRRSRLDMRLGQTLRIGQRWRRRKDGAIATIHMIHRTDCDAILIRHGHRELVTFEQLRTGWDLLVSLDEAAA